MLTPERKQLIHSIAPMYRALYLYQTVLFSDTYNEDMPFPYVLIELNRYNLEDDGYLSLRSVKDLTEDEVKVFSGLPLRDERDFLRSIGVITCFWHPTTGRVSEEDILLAGIAAIRN